jgi:hypothetical protein
MRRLLGVASLVLALVVGDPAAATGTPYEVGTGSASAGAASSIAVTTTAAVTSGDLLFIFAGDNSNTSISGVSGGPGCTEGAWQASTGQQNGSSAKSQAFYCTASADFASGGTITVSYASTTGAKAVYIAGVCGTTTPVTTNGATGTSTTPTFTTGSVATGAIVLAAAGVGSGNTDSFTEDANFTLLGTLNAQSYRVRVAWRVTVSTGAVTYTLTDNTSSRAWTTQYLTASSGSACGGGGGGSTAKSGLLRRNGG